MKSSVQSHCSPYLNLQLRLNQNYSIYSDYKIQAGKISYVELNNVEGHF